jgi:DNA invertase Pin-like site-specific DNA recombinase
MLNRVKYAAQYIRMSTDMQRYSIDNQAAAISLYAATRGLILMKSYVDAGRSGLSIEKRNALKTLIDDVLNGRAEYDVVLVYDVSRWGRFQDTDESAYYEFVCRRAGVAIEYCAEQFENDGSLLTTILKNLKRAMAGEFSRELSVKVHAGQSRLAAQGHRFGPAGYALRRMLVDETGKHKYLLGPGDRKSLKSEYSILVPGLEKEVAVVRYVYDQFINQQKSITEIARNLNAQGNLNANGRPWVGMTVRQLLTNEKYIGTNVYNRTSKRLGDKQRVNPQSEWVRKVGAFEPIISPKRFCQAQQRLKTIAYKFSKNDMLDCLVAIWCKNGLLSRDIIDASPTTPSTNSYKNRFGSLTKAFELVGFNTHRLANRANLLNIRNGICDLISAEVSRRGGTVRRLTSHNCQLCLNEGLHVLVVIGRASPSAAAKRQNQWRFGYRCQKKPDILVVARVDHGSSSVRDFYLLPFIFFPHGSWLTVSGINYQRLEPFRSLSLDPLFDLCARQPLNARSVCLTDAN